LDAKWERLKTSKSSGDRGREGLRLEINGGYNDKKRKQKAIVEFICDRTRVGNEYLWDPADKNDDGKEKREGKEDETAPEDDKTPSLSFSEYDTKGDDFDILRLDWRTKYACEDAKQKKDAEKAARWGFFTWFIIMYVTLYPNLCIAAQVLIMFNSAFLSTATYLIFGSWLNYNRYGARGWDLLPHGDAIRDVPYLMKDWIRRVVNTVQGPGSRGGYAAV
jgi:hypothetical protein